MFKKNMGRLDRIVRFIVEAALIPIGLFLLGGWQGKSVRYYCNPLCPGAALAKANRLLARLHPLWDFYPR